VVLTTQLNERYSKMAEDEAKEEKDEE